MLICMRESAKQESAKHGACVPVHDPERTYPLDRIVCTPNFLLSLGWFCWSTLGRSRSRLRLMRYKASAKQLLGAILCNDLEHRDIPGALCLPYNLQENPHPSLLRNREGTKRGTPYRDGGRPGAMGMGTATTIRARQHSAQDQKQYQHKR